MERTDQEKAHDTTVDSCVWKTESHKEHHIEDIKLGQVRLYGVTTIAASPRFGRTRTPVVCTTFERACFIVEQNEGDIWESSYMLVVIEAFASDELYSQFSGEMYWYKWDPVAGRYRPIEIPAAYENAMGFGIG